MSFHPDQFRRLIEETLLSIKQEAARPEAVELLMMTSAHETHLGRYLWQVNLPPSSGGACGPFQMEPATHDDVQFRLIVKTGKYPWIPLAEAKRMIWDLKYAILMARIYFMQFPEPIPDKDDIWGLAEYYKQFWNTQAGSAKVGAVIENYRLYAY